jgi:hypothetical protein
MTGLTNTAWRTRRGSRTVGVHAAVAIAAVLWVTPTTVFAGAQVHGSSEAVTIEAQNTSIEEILATIGKSFDVHYQSSVNLEKQITGTYQGSLPQVLARVLEGYNFIAKTNKERVEIRVFGSRLAPAVAKASPNSTGSKAAPALAASPAPAPKSTKVAEEPVPSTSPAIFPPMIQLAEGPTPPIPSPPSSSSKGPVPVPHSTSSVPMPTPGSSTSGPERLPSSLPPPAFVSKTKPADSAPPALVPQTKPADSALPAPR